LGEAVDGFPEWDGRRSLKRDAPMTPPCIALARIPFRDTAPIGDLPTAPLADRRDDLGDGAVPEVERDQGGPGEPVVRITARRRRRTDQEDGPGQARARDQGGPSRHRARHRRALRERGQPKRPWIGLALTSSRGWLR